MADPAHFIFTLATRHAYLDGIPDRQIGFRPTPETARLMQEHGVSARSHEGSLQVARYAARKDWFPDPEGTVLTFAVHALRDTVFQYTDLPLGSIGRGCARAPRNDDARRFAPADPAPYASYEALADWLAETRAFLLVDIPVARLTEEQVWFLDLPARIAHWRLHVHARAAVAAPSDRMAVEGMPEGFAFRILDTGAADADGGVLLESETPWPLSPRGFSSARLILERSGRPAKTLFSGLPAPAPDTLRLVEGDEVPRADVFLYV